MLAFRFCQYESTYTQSSVKMGKSFHEKDFLWEGEHGGGEESKQARRIEEEKQKQEALIRITIYYKSGQYFKHLVRARYHGIVPFEHLLF